MKTKLQVLTAVIAVVGFSQATKASKESRIAAILGENKLAVVKPITPFIGFSSSSTQTMTQGNSVNVTDNVTGTDSYHHGDGGDDDGVKGKNIVYVGVGFVSITGLLTSAYTAEGYATAGSIPPITIAYERGLSSHFAFGIQFEYSGFSLSVNEPATFGFNNGNPYSDKLTLSGIGVGLIGTYSFVTSGRIDPYFGYGIGYEIFSFSWTTTDTQSPGDGNINPGSISGGLPWFNLFFGSRFYITDHFGAYVDLGWHGLVGGIINVGLTAKF
jgi:hypothetical protein